MLSHERFFPHKPSITTSCPRVAEGRQAVLAYLLDNGADPNIGTNENHYEPGSTPLMASAERNEIECFNILVDKGADLFKTREDGADAIYIAARFGHLELIQTFFSLQIGS